MRGSADVAGLPEVWSRRAFFRFEIVCQDQAPEIRLESTPDFSHSEMRAARTPFFGMRFSRNFFMDFIYLNTWDNRPVICISANSPCWNAKSESRNANDFSPSSKRACSRSFKVA
jgi:hypothetical protein